MVVTTICQGLASALRALAHLIAFLRLSEWGYCNHQREKKKKLAQERLLTWLKAQLDIIYLGQPCCRVDCYQMLPCFLGAMELQPQRKILVSTYSLTPSECTIPAMHLDVLK